MSKDQPASLKSTSGAGYNFEDEVAAKFLTEMLAGRPSLDPEWGVATRLRRQVAALEPHGDIVLSFSQKGGGDFECAVSVKSSFKLTRSGLQKDAVAAMWAVLDSPGFKRNEDKLGIASQPTSQESSFKFHDLIKRAKHTAPSMLVGNLRGQIEKSVYESLAPVNSESGLPGLLLQHLTFRDSFDFEKSVSEARSEAIRICGSLLVSSNDTNDEPFELWNCLVNFAGKLRVTGGETTVSNLLQLLKHKFRLKDAPETSASWNKLLRISNSSISGVSVSLPNGGIVSRAEHRRSLDTLLNAGAGIIGIVGPSGSGKSALAKMYVEGLSPQEVRTVWLGSPELSRLELESSEFMELLQLCRSARGIVVLDGAEHWNEADFLWIRGLISSRAGLPKGWCFIVTCQQQEWRRVCVKLSISEDAAILCDIFSDTEFNEIAQDNLAIRSLDSRPHLRKVIRSPQMLRTILEAPASAEDAEPGWATETDVVEWWWRERVCDGKQLARAGTLAREIAGALANELVVELPESIANGSEEAAALLISKGILRRTEYGAVRFVHDLYADWSRVHQLAPMGAGVLEFMRGHIENPPWFRSLRIYCQQLLDRDENLSRWRQLIQPLIPAVLAEDELIKTVKASPKDLRLLDAALEAVVHCGNPEKAFERIADDVLANNSALLRRLLRSMLQSTTEPDPIVLKLAKSQTQADPKQLEQMARVSRIPQMQYWHPMIAFLISHKESVVPSIAVELSRVIPIVSTLMGYLQRTGSTLPAWYTDLCELAVLCGEQELRWEIEGAWRPRNYGEATGSDPRLAIYRAAQLAADTLPERVARFALKAVGRVGWEHGDLPDRIREGWLGERSLGHSPMSEDWRVIRPIVSWEHGPMRETSDSFDEAWLNGGAISLFKQKPAAACEVTLATLIDWPKLRASNSGLGSQSERHGFKFLHDRWYPPFWHHGPFLPFLRIAPTHGIQLMVTLVNFATDRVREWWPYEDSASQQLIFDSPVGQVVWGGHPNVYGWHIDSLNTVEPVTCALMALEKWMMDELEGGRSIEDAVHHLFREGKSIAFAGLLMTIGKSRPELLISTLKPLLYQWRCYIWDRRTRRTYLGTGGGWFSDPDFINEMRRHWADQPHRHQELQHVCFQLMADRPEVRVLFGSVAAQWLLQAAMLPEDDPEKLSLRRLASDFDFTTWTEVKSSDGSTGWTIQRPPELCDEDEAERQRINLRLMEIPYQCKKVLEQRTPISDSVAESWWHAFAQTLKLLEEQETSDKRDREPPQPTASGIMAVLLCLAPSWLTANPEKLGLVEATVLSLLKNSQPSPPELGRIGCGLFLSRCIIRLWSLNPDNRQWRACSGSAIASTSYTVVESMMEEAYIVRRAIGDGFSDLCFIALAYAEQRREADDPYRRDEAKIERLQKWQAEWWPKFAEGILPKIDIEWGLTLGLRQSITSETDEGDEDDDDNLTPAAQNVRTRIVRRASYGFDVKLVVSAFQAIPSDERESGCTEAELERWRLIDRNLVSALLRTLPDKATCEDQDRAPRPYEPDENILLRIAVRCLTAKDPRNAEAFWKPLVDKGPNAVQFTRSLLSKMRLGAIKDPGLVPRLLPIWKGMIEFVQTSSAWASKGRRCRDELWDDLLFIGQFSDWKDNVVFEPLVVSLADHYRTTLSDDKVRDHRLANFIYFLSGEAARSMTPQVFEWCANRVKRVGGIDWRESGLRNSFSRLVETGWKHCFGSIRDKSDSFACFKTLVAALAAMHDPVCTEIQAAIGRTEE